MRAWEQKRARERLLSRVVPLNVARIHSVRSRFWVTACNPNFLFFYFFSNSISQDPPVVRHILRDSLPGTHLVPYHLNLQYSGPVAP